MYIQYVHTKHCLQLSCDPTCLIVSHSNVPIHCVQAAPSHYGRQSLCTPPTLGSEKTGGLFTLCNGLEKAACPDGKTVRDIRGTYSVNINLSKYQLWVVRAMLRKIPGLGITLCLSVVHTYVSGASPLSYLPFHQIDSYKYKHSIHMVWAGVGKYT